MSRSRLMISVIVFAALVTAMTAATHHGHTKRERPNVVLIVLDTVRRDVTDLSLAEQGEPVMPRLAELARTSTVFTNAWANAPWTVPSHASLFTGLAPSVHGCQSHSPMMRSDLTTLAEVLNNSGYETGAFFSNPWLGDDVSGVLRGFETRGEARSNGGHALDGSDQGGAEVIMAADDWVRSRSDDRPFFLFVNILEAHLPYELPEELLRMEGITLGEDKGVSVEWAHEYNAGLFPENWKNTDRIRHFYSLDVSLADWLLTGLLGRLEGLGALDNTVIIVTSDHGENLGDHGLMDHQFSIHETLLAVPLLIHLPGATSPTVREDPVMLTDLFATVLELAGADAHAVPPGSTSLVGQRTLDPERPLTAEYGGAQEGLLQRLESYNHELNRQVLMPAYSTVRVGDLRLTVGSDGSTILHDLASDPGQTVDISGSRAEAVERLSALLPGSGSPRRSARSDVHPLSSTDRERLESLGYIQ